MASGVPSDVMAVLGNLNGSNEARLALLEKRFAIPPSPATSREANSQLSCPGARDSTPGPENDAPESHRTEAPWHSLDGLELSTDINATKKRRRTSLGPGAAGGRGGVSPPQNSLPGFSPFRPTAHPQERDREASRGAASSPPSSRRQRNTISRYFSTSSNANSSDGMAAVEAAVKAQTAALAAAELHAAQLKMEAEEARRDLQAARAAREDAEDRLAAMQAELGEARRAGAAQIAHVRATLLRLARTCAALERESTAQSLRALAPRLGSLGVRRRGIEVQEVWEEGQAFRDLRAKLTALAEQRDAIEAARKAAKRRLPLPGQPLPEERNEGTDAAGTSTSTLHPEDWVVQEEIYKARLAATKREEEMVKVDLARLETEKMLYIRDLKRVRDEDASRFSNFPVLNDRYVLLDLLGRGGFSEVYRAFDLSSQRDVACKIHQLNGQWSELKKASYVKHSVREYHIHKKLHHPRIVSLVDIFEIDNNTFATVLELCEGGDLDSYCKLHEVLPEKEARTIVTQVLSGLQYLNTKPHSVIHYDLKPANILFDGVGEVKLTDFGLSKVVDDGQTMGMELTSQGAGTYWYLPPECFEVRRTPLISNKVDVWSVGVILYQMLLGRRPFGHDQSQEQILRNEVMLNAREVKFPTKPAISQECKDFIRSCLAYKQEDRLDVAAAAAHPYLSVKSRERRQSVSGREAAAGQPTS
ncbi:hypothetical protein ACKKBG_A32735 [Auxenochlorella protothecoides x Auxenochlorella symbiontica]|uniref:Protein kinase domain-containing protein n=2 Tax=Auxenochlorella protothecoides TaxID=3075 RepID=A0A1D1ZRD1_AUXPR|nr:hypothetical protein APUTEX25_004022 [Auxenochlorella protothecoides]|eukprot:RMZ57188.1 hypothetical protein APUTEX25_004022 [Auxenochlorella protothecoides]